MLLLDFDGTLVDVRDKYYFVYSSYARQHGRTPIPSDEFWELKRSNAPESVILQRTGIPPSSVTLAEFVRDHVETEAALRHDTLFPWTHDALRGLSAKHECVLLSARRDRAQLLRQLSSLGLTSYFRAVICAVHLPEHQVHPEDTPKAVALADTTLTRPALIAGDSGMDILTGRRLSLSTCAVTSGIRDENVLRSYSPDYLVPNLEYLPAIVGV